MYPIYNPNYINNTKALKTKIIKKTSNKILLDIQYTHFDCKN